MEIAAFPSEPPPTPEQCKDGRLLARWSLADLAGRSGIDPLTVQRFEAGEAPEIGVRIGAAFRRHGLELEERMGAWRWLLEGLPFNRMQELWPHGGMDLEWPGDLPAELTERPVPVPWWANDDGDRDIVPSRLNDLEAEWVRRNPDAALRFGGAIVDSVLASTGAQ